MGAIGIRMGASVTVVVRFGEELSDKLRERNLPFVIRKGASSWAAAKEWNAKYLADVMGEQLVNVAITPHGCPAFIC